MQILIAELSNVIEQGELEKAWHSGDAINPLLKVHFAFAGRRISIMLEPGPEGRWQTESVHRSFSSAVRRVDQRCNIRWI